MSLCEVRIPTYRRPAMLRRCLESLLAQTHSDWVAIVQDDSLDFEGRAVVKAINDPRLIYRPNEQQLGCCGNLDRAFANEPVAGGEYACVVEDDNWLLPRCLEENLKALSASGKELVLRNQIVAHETPGAAAKLTSQRTLGDIFGEADRCLTPLQIRGSIFFGCGLSNGGIFWKLQMRSSLVVGPSVSHSLMQEYCRSLQAVEPVFYASEPLAVFSLPVDGVSSREALAYRRYNRGRQAIIERLLKHHGESLIEAARGFYQPGGLINETIAQALADCGFLIRAIKEQIAFPIFKFWMKGVVKRWFIDDPTSEYWKLKGDEVIKSVPPSISQS